MDSDPAFTAWLAQGFLDDDAFDRESDARLADYVDQGASVLLAAQPGFIPLFGAAPPGDVRQPPAAGTARRVKKGLTPAEKACQRRFRERRKTQMSALEQAAADKRAQVEELEVENEHLRATNAALEDLVGQSATSLDILQSMRALRVADAQEAAALQPHDAPPGATTPTPYPPDDAGASFSEDAASSSSTTSARAPTREAAQSQGSASSSSSSRAAVGPGAAAAVVAAEDAVSACLQGERLRARVKETVTQLGALVIQAEAPGPGGAAAVAVIDQLLNDTFQWVLRFALQHPLAIKVVRTVSMEDGRPLPPMPPGYYERALDGARLSEVTARRFVARVECVRHRFMAIVQERAELIAQLHALQRETQPADAVASALARLLPPQHQPGPGPGEGAPPVMWAAVGAVTPEEALEAERRQLTALLTAAHTLPRQVGPAVAEPADRLLQWMQLLSQLERNLTKEHALESIALPTVTGILPTLEKARLLLACWPRLPDPFALVDALLASHPELAPPSRLLPPPLAPGGVLPL